MVAFLGIVFFIGLFWWILNGARKKEHTFKEPKPSKNFRSYRRYKD